MRYQHYKVKFAELISRFIMERKYIGLHESWHDMNPLMKDKQMEMDFQEEELNMDLKDNSESDILGEKCKKY